MDHPVHHVGLRDLRLEHRVQLVVDQQLAVVEIEVGEDLVLGKDVVQERDLLEEVPLRQLLQLAVARQQEKQLVYVLRNAFS